MTFSIPSFSVSFFEGQLSYSFTISTKKKKKIFKKAKTILTEVAILGKRTSFAPELTEWYFEDRLFNNATAPLWKVWFLVKRFNLASFLTFSNFWVWLFGVFCGFGFFLMKDHHQHHTHFVTGKIYSSCNGLTAELNAEGTAKQTVKVSWQSKQLLKELSSSLITASGQILAKQTCGEML